MCQLDPPEKNSLCLGPFPPPGSQARMGELTNRDAVGQVGGKSFLTATVDGDNPRNRSYRRLLFAPNVAAVRGVGPLW